MYKLIQIECVFVFFELTEFSIVVAEPDRDSGISPQQHYPPHQFPSPQVGDNFFLISSLLSGQLCFALSPSSCLVCVTVCIMIVDPSHNVLTQAFTNLLLRS